MMRSFSSPLPAVFIRDESGAALVEFAMVLPMMLLTFGLIVEGGRTYLGYQTTSAGLRDATRYLSRAVQADACTTNATNTDRFEAKLTKIVGEAQSGEALFPGGITIVGVESSITCHTGGFRQGAVPVATVTARLRIRYPFSGLIALTGANTDPVTTVLRDQTRVVGS